MAKRDKGAKPKKRPVEQYDHKGKKRVNNPPVGLVTPQTDPLATTHKTYEYDPHLDPQLVWAGKKEHTSFDVPTVSLHVHERIDPRTIIEAVRRRNGNGRPIQGFLFETKEENPPLREAIDFYRHAHGWSNRLIAGDSLLVMNSLLEKEGMAGQVQMVYIDPPYGIRYGSNFQPFVNRRDVKDGKDEDLTQEPEMVRAFRDTWELGIHSYLTYLRDRLLLARDLLHESGSCFVQISDENLHHVREVMDEMFGPENFVALILYRRGGFQTTELIPSTFDYFIWYGRDRERTKFHPLFLRILPEDWFAGQQRWIQSPDGNRKKFEPGLPIPQGWKVLSHRAAYSATGSEASRFPVSLNGVEFMPPANRGWSTNKEGFERLKNHGRLLGLGSSLRYLPFYDDFPYGVLTNGWNDTVTSGFGEKKTYVVQTASLIVQRCMLMCPDPGDIVFDPTCGSGTSAFVAEQWGRRWITCDTSRVATTLAKQRLMGATFDYYKLAHPNEGVGSGFEYKKVPHVTLKSIANNEPPGEETLYDQPLIDNSRARISGPFTVEAVPAPNVKSIDELGPASSQVEVDGMGAGKSRSLTPQTARGFGMTGSGSAREGGMTGSGWAREVGVTGVSADASIARSGPTLRQSDWRDELLKTGIRGKGGQMIHFSRVEPLGGTRWLHADAETKAETRNQKAERVVITFGPDYAPLEQRQVEMAWEEARTLIPKPSIIVFAAFQFDPEAAKDIDELTKEKTGLTFLTAQMNADLLTEDLKKKRSSNQSFWLIGRPDVEIRRVKPSDSSGRKTDPSHSFGMTTAGYSAPPHASDLYIAEVRGFDYYNTRTGTIESGVTSKIAMWLLDTDYDGRSLYPRQVFFPLADADEGWAKLARNLKAEIDLELIEAYRGTVSLPFALGDHKRVAVKVIDDRGIESLKVATIE